MRKNFLLLALFSVMLVASSVLAQEQMITVPNTKTVEMFSRVDGSADDWMYTRYRSFTDGLFYEPTTGNMLKAFRTWDAIAGGGIVQCLISTDGGDSWTFLDQVNFGLPGVEGINCNYGVSAWGNSMTPIIAYITRYHTDPNMDYVPTIVTDVTGWTASGAWWNRYVDEESDPDSIIDYAYPDFMVAPDNPDHWLFAAWHYNTAVPGEQLNVYRSNDAGMTWSRPKTPISATSADEGKPNYFYNIMSSGALIDMGMNGNAFVAGEIQEVSGAWYQAVYATSDDGGTTWSDPMVVPGTETLTNNINDGTLNKMSVVDDAGNWHLVQMVIDTSDTNEVRKYIDCIYDGTTWDIVDLASPMREDLFGNGLTRQAREHGTDIAIDDDGTVYFFYMDLEDTTGGYIYGSYVKYSEDNGDTWMGPVRVGEGFNNTYYATDVAYYAGDYLHVTTDYRADPDSGIVYHYYFGIPTAEIKSMVSVSDPVTDNIPESYELHQNFPNPFNPLTSIRFDLKEQAHVTIKIYNELGQEVALLVDEMMTAGQKGVSWNASQHPSGVYFYQITAGDFTASKKMVLAK